MSAIPVEIANISFRNTNALERAIYFTNKHQKTFTFKLLKEENFETYRPKQIGFFETEEIYDLMDHVFMELGGFHDRTIGVVENRLDGKKWSNLFGSMQTNENDRLTGKAITSTYGIGSILQSIPIEIYYIFEFLSFSIRFIVGKGMIHDNERGCLFHRKVDKNDILEAINSGYISLSSQKQINEYLELEQIIAFKTLLSIISEISRSDEPTKSFQDYLIKDGYIVQNPGHSQVFISYSHEDKKLLERIKVHLKPYVKKGEMDLWDDTKIKPGMLWRDEIKKALDSAKVAVLLVSADFLASDFIVDSELPPLLSAAELEGTLIIPVILKPCAFSDSKLEQFQSINPPSEPLNGMNRNKREQVFAELAKAVKEALDR